MSAKLRRYGKRMAIAMLACLFFWQLSLCLSKFYSGKIVEEVSIKRRTKNLLPPLTICKYPGLKDVVPWGEDRRKGIKMLCPNVTIGQDYYEDCLKELIVHVEDDFDEIFMEGGASVHIEPQ